MYIRILIADDHEIFRSGLKALLEKEEDFQIIGETGTGYDTVKAALKDDVDLLLLDISMPGLSGADVVKSVLQRRPELPIVILTMHEDEYYMKEFFKLGVKAYVLKKSSGDELLQAIRSASKGNHYIDPALASRVIDPFIGKKSPDNKNGQLNQLTKREQEVLELLAFGHTNAEISRQLEISKRTVESHRSRLMAKLEIKSRADLVRFAISNNLMKRS